MDSDDFQFLLYRVAADLSETDLKSIKFLVTGSSGISVQQLESADANGILEMLKERNSDMSIFGELLRVIGRLDLYEKVRPNVCADTPTCCQLPALKVLMFHIARSMSKEDRRIVCFYFDVDDDSYDGIDLMTLIETRTPVGSDDKLRQFMDKRGLTHLYVRARSTATFTPRSLLRMPSLCDRTGCRDSCPYRPLWSEKFPHQFSPVFPSERLLCHGDVNTDDDNTAKELLGEGRFGKVYKGL